MTGERTRVLLCNTIGCGSGVLPEGWDDGTEPITSGRQTEGGRVANGEAETEEDDTTAGGASLDNADEEATHSDGGMVIFVGVQAPDT